MNQQAEILKSLQERKPTQKQRLLDALRKGGRNGVLNTDLLEICNSYDSRISEFYQAGYVIELEHIEKGLCRYTLISEPDREITNNPTAVQLLFNEINSNGGTVTVDELSNILSQNNFNVVRRSGSFKKKAKSVVIHN